MWRSEGASVAQLAERQASTLVAWVRIPPLALVRSLTGRAPAFGAGGPGSSPGEPVGLV